MPSKICRLYLVCYDEHTGDSDGPDNHDQFVIASSSDEATQLWRDYNIGVFTAGEDEEDVPNIKADWNSKVPDNVFTVPEDELLNRTPRVIGWDLIRGER